MESFAPEVLVAWCQRTLPDDTRGFEALVAQYQGRVYATAYRLMGNRQDAEDQAQEAFLKIYRSIRGLEDPTHLAAWITRVTVNTCLDALGKQRRRPQTTSITPEGDDHGEPSYVDSQSPNPEQEALRRELRHCLEATLGQMELTARSVLLLREINDCSYQEIADTLALGLSAVKMRIHRARQTFQQILERVCPGTARAAGPADH